jgi:hypothetical protein
MNSILKGINAISTPAVSFALGVVTGFLGSVLSPLAKENASAALDLRKKIDEVLFALDEFVNSTPQDLRCTVFSGIRRLPLKEAKTLSEEHKAVLLVVLGHRRKGVSPKLGWGRY